MDADVAARRIVDAVLRGDPMVVLTPLAWLGVRVRGLAPATTTRVLGLVGRLLPGGAGPVGTVEGREAERRLGSRAVRLATTLGRWAAQRNNERPTDSA